MGLLSHSHCLTSTQRLGINNKERMLRWARSGMHYTGDMGSFSHRYTWGYVPWLIVKLKLGIGWMRTKFLCQITEDYSGAL